ncbi:MAG: DNA mismatch repair endonuclease MutL [Promethearchaeota archaeon]
MDKKLHDKIEEKRIKIIKNYEKIAAGEVVERPSSVVKELIENSIDAHASKIHIIIKNAGKDLIQVIDDGDGINPDDIEIAFQPHTSSKIDSAEDILSLNTLGFRGEALYSIATISRVEIISKTRLHDYGMKCIIEGGKILLKQKVGAPDGTNIKVMNLFYNTPARFKFLKSNRVELGHITDIITRMILLHPEIHFKFVSNGKTIINSPATTNYRNILFNLYGKNIVNKVVEFNHEEEDIKIKGFLGDPSLSRSSTISSSVYVNNRFVISPLINKAMDEAYKDFLMTKKHPFYILFIELDPSKIDVNVHPTKKIIRFENESEFYLKIEKIMREIVINKFGYKKSIDLIKASSSNSPIYSEHKIAALNSGKDYGTSNISISELKNITKSSIEAKEELRKKIRNSEKSALDLLKSQQKITDQISMEQTIGNEFKNEELEKSNINFGPKKDIKLTNMYAIEKRMEPSNKIKQNIPKVPTLSELLIQRDWIDTNGVFPKLKVPNEASQLNKLYFILEGEDGFYILDMHAAHERINYEKQLKMFKEGKISKQTLLIPIKFDAPLAEVEFIKNSLNKISKFGFEIDFFGGNTFAIRTVPAQMKEIMDPNIIKDICLEIVNMGKEFSLEKEYERVLKYTACRMSIKGGLEIDDPMKVVKLIQNLAKCENPHHCAHGRPTMLYFSYKDIDAMFHRK